MYHSNGKSSGAYVKHGYEDDFYDDHELQKLHSEDFLEMFELNLPAVDTNKIETATLNILEASADTRACGSCL
jgi:hypothetical protein